MKTYKHNFAKFDLATKHLNNQETMIYLRLIWAMYETEEPLPNDTFILSKLAQDSDERLVQFIVDKYFEIEDVGVTHKYVRRQLNQSQAMKRRMSGLAKKSWEKLPEDGEKFWKSLPDEKKYKHKKSPTLLIIPFRRNNIDVDKLIEFTKSYFKNTEDPNYWKSPKKLVEEFLQDPTFRYGKDKINDYVRGVK